MISLTHVPPHPARAALVAVLVSPHGCRVRRQAQHLPPGTAQPDRFLFERGTEALKNEEWLNAREYFQQIVDDYPQSPLRPDAKLGVGDSYLGEDSAESLVLAAHEFREFLQFYPTNPRADYAQYKLAMSHFEQMRAPERDQTETREALKEFDVFFQRYPNSPLTPEVKQNWRDRPRSPERGVLPRRPALLPAALVSGRHRPLPRGPPRRPRLHAAGTPSTSIWRSRWPEPIRQPKPSRTSSGCSRNSRAASTSRTPR